MNWKAGVEWSIHSQLSYRWKLTPSRSLGSKSALCNPGHFPEMKLQVLFLLQLCTVQTGAYHFTDRLFHTLWDVTMERFPIFSSLFKMKSLEVHPGMIFPAVQQGCASSDSCERLSAPCPLQTSQRTSRSPPRHWQFWFRRLRQITGLHRPKLMSEWSSAPADEVHSAHSGFVHLSPSSRLHDSSQCLRELRCNL